MRVFLYDSRGGSINSEEINSDIGSGVNGEKLGAGYVQKCFSITLFMYKVTSNKNTHFYFLQIIRSRRSRRISSGGKSLLQG